MLWDFLPGGTFPGGAPFNVGYHLHCHDLAVHVASAIGRDELGNELLRRLQVWGLGTSGVAVHPDLPTGSVRARLSAGGDAHYEIATGVAWDRIAAEGSLAATTRADALVFGSLAQRTPFNRTSLQHLLAALPPTALRVFDVNFRPPHDDLPLIRRLATQATLLKLNDGEAARLCAGNPAASDVESHARFLATETGCVRVVITAAARGAGLLGRDGRWHWEPGRPVAVADTVGAGDAFLAALLSGLLRGRDDAAALAHACRVGEWVATQRGATPDYAAGAPAP